MCTRFFALVFASFISLVGAQERQDIVLVADWSGHDEIWTVSSTDVGSVRRITHLAGDLVPRHTKWSPDGRWIAFIAFLAEQSSHEVFVVSSDGSSDPERLTTFPGPESAIVPDFGDSSEWVYFIKSFPATRSEIWRVHVGTRELEPVNLEPNTNFQTYDVSNSGSLRVEMKETGCCFTPNMFTVLHDTRSGIVDLILPTDGNAEWFPRFSNDEARIVFYQAAGSGLPTNIWLMKVDGTDRIALTADGGPIHNALPAWSPDDRRVLYEKLDVATGQRDLYLLDLELATDEPFLATAGAERDPDWLRPQIRADFFEGFSYQSLEGLSSNWLISGSQGVDGCAPVGPQETTFCRDRVSVFPFAGVVRLSGHVERDRLGRIVRYGAELELREDAKRLPAQGTFAARIRFDQSGPGSGGEFGKNPHQSVKTFFTHRRLDACRHMEHDFEVFTERNEALLAGLLDPEVFGEVLKEESPVLTVVTHRADGCPQIPNKIDHAVPDVDPAVSLASSEFWTLVLNLSCTRNCQDEGQAPTREYTAEYSIVSDDRKVVHMGRTVTDHPVAIETLPLLFNLWWVNPLFSAEGSPDSQWTQMDLDWFYWTEEHLEPLQAHEIGQGRDDRHENPN